MYLRNALQPDLFSAGGDQFLADLQHLRANLTRFASGLSRVRDFKVAAWSGHGVGVEIGEMSAAAIGELARVIVDYGCPAFCDSGAFGVFQRTLRGGAPTPLDFDDILRRYDALSDAIEGYNAAETPFPAPLMVMPDIVGDQLGSLALIEHHRTYVRSAAFFPGVSRPIIPIQRGPIPLAEIYQRLVDLLETEAFIVGVPSQAVGIAPHEFVAFLQQARPKAVHILGAFADSRLTPRLSQIVEAGLARSISVSTDGNPLRSIIIEAGQGADGRREALRSKLGAAARRRELSYIIDDLGGPGALPGVYAAHDPQGRQRLIGLLADFSDLPHDQVIAAFGFQPAAILTTAKDFP